VVAVGGNREVAEVLIEIPTLSSPIITIIVVVIIACGAEINGVKLIQNNK
jgi:hypothetical protein